MFPFPIRKLNYVPETVGGQVEIPKDNERFFCFIKSAKCYGFPPEDSVKNPLDALTLYIEGNA